MHSFPYKRFFRAFRPHGKAFLLRHTPHRLGARFRESSHGRVVRDDSRPLAAFHGADAWRRRPLDRACRRARRRSGLTHQSRVGRRRRSVRSQEAPRFPRLRSRRSLETPLCACRSHARRSRRPRGGPHRQGPSRGAAGCARRGRNARSRSWRRLRASAIAGRSGGLRRPPPRLGPASLLDGRLPLDLLGGAHSGRALPPSHSLLRRGRQCSGQRKP